MQHRNGRRGSVFAVRLTDAERGKLEELQARGGGPRALGPWLVWSAIARVLPEQLAPSSGNTRSSGSSAWSGTTAGGGITSPAARRRVLDLCSGSGAWSEPYRSAGYHVERVSLPGDDVRTYVPPADVWGVLAAPPCDQFSLARNGHPESERDVLRGLEVVSACMRIILQCKPRWWALENPVGLLSRWLGTPRDVWEPCDFGDPWTKRTAIWGEYCIPERGPFVRPLGGGPFCAICDPERRKTTWCSRADHRAVTPRGFARAFFEANP